MNSSNTTHDIFGNTTESDTSINPNGLYGQINMDRSGLMVFKVTLPILMPLGLILNALTFFTMRRPALRNLTTCVYLSYLSVADSLCLLVQGSRRAALAFWGVNIDVLTRCILFPYISSHTVQIPSWFLIITALDRYNQVSHVLFFVYLIIFINT